MKIVVIGGSGLIGTKLVERLRAAGHDVTAASPSSGVNALTGEGVAEAMEGADVVVDVANSPSFEDGPVLEFFQKCGHHLLTAEAAAGVRHHVALSVIGADRMPTLGYMRAKVAQEELIEQSGVPYTIVRATQFFEFVGSLAHAATDGGAIRVGPVQMQPIAADDVAAALAEVAAAAPAGRVTVAGPDRLRQDELMRRYLSATGDTREVVADDDAGYFGGKIEDDALVPTTDDARIAATTFADWLSRQEAK